MLVLKLALYGPARDLAMVMKSGQFGAARTVQIATCTGVSVNAHTCSAERVSSSMGAAQMCCSTDLALHCSKSQSTLRSVTHAVHQALCGPT